MTMLPIATCGHNNDSQDGKKDKQTATYGLFGGIGGHFLIVRHKK